MQRGDQSLSTSSIRGPEGGAIGFETGSGARAGIGRSEEGDLYAGKDGQVYKRDDDGWYQQGDDGWNRVELSEERATQVDQARSQAAERRSSFETADRSDRTYDSLRNRNTYDSNRRSELDRSYKARTSGYQRYNQRNLSSGQFNQQRLGGGQRPRRRR